MALFGKKPEATPGVPRRATAEPSAAAQVFCRICNKYRPFSKCWRRTAHVEQCPCCGLVFQDAQALYKRFQPVCPRCGEYLEQPGFEYGLCDACASKFELTGGKPGLLPNKRQRDEMSKHGKSWSRD